MIGSNQPTVFPDDIIVAVSSRDDGTMLDRFKLDHETHDTDNRHAFCKSIGIDYQDVVGQMIVYGDEMTYDFLETVGTEDTSRHVRGVIADGLTTTSVGIGLMLPVADCVATVIYDAHQRQLYLLHLGRHSTLTPFLEETLKSILAAGTDPSDIFIWMSPHAGKDSYVMQYFDNADDPAWQNFYQKTDEGYYLDLAGYNRNVCLSVGVPADRIEVSEVDTVTSAQYFSHSAGDHDKRFAVVAMMRP